MWAKLSLILGVFKTLRSLFKELKNWWLASRKKKGERKMKKLNTQRRAIMKKIEESKDDDELRKLHTNLRKLDSK